MPGLEPGIQTPAFGVYGDMAIHKLDPDPVWELTRPSKRQRGEFGCPAQRPGMTAFYG